jgi:hypothetical protein
MNASEKQFSINRQASRNQIPMHNTNSKTSPGSLPCFSNKSLLLAAFLAVAGTARHAAAWEVRQLTSDGGIKSGVCAQNGSVLWTRVDGSKAELYLWNGQYTTNLTAVTGLGGGSGSLYNGTVAWIGNNGRIYYWNGSNTVQVTTETAVSRPSLYAGTIAWTHIGDSNTFTLHYWDGATTQVLDTWQDPTWSSWTCSLYNGKIAYFSGGAGGGVWYWDGTKRVPVDHSGTAPSLYDGKIAYVQSGYYISYWNGTNRMEVDLDSEVPSLCAGKIAYSKLVNNKSWQIMFWDGVTNHQMTFDPATVSDGTPALDVSPAATTIAWIKNSGGVADEICIAKQINPWTFVMLGDTRGHHDTTTGVSVVLAPIATKIAELNPDLVVCCGDQINGDATNGLTPLSYAQMFDNWKAAMQPVIASNIPIYTVRGNHENSADEGPPMLDLKQAYFDALGTNMPGNGPNNGPADDQRGYTYSFTRKNVFFAVVDQYFYPVSATNGGYHSIDQTWLSQQLQRSYSPYKIVMAHEPVYVSHFYGTDPAGEADRAQFWDSLGGNGTRIYVCGHVHNLSVCVAPDDYGNDIYQVLAGNGGAELDEVSPDPEAGMTVTYYNTNHYGFALATVGTDAITIEYYLLDKTGTKWSKATYTTTVPAVQPRVSVAVGSSTVTVSWPLTPDAWVLEQTNRLANGSASWPVVTAPYTTNATSTSVTLPATPDKQFFRLRRQP